MGELDGLEPEDPRRIGPYWLEARLGSGGMGRVYLGRSPGGRQVAIKVIRPELAEDADFRTRFAREVSAARKVSGIFTASVVDADLDGPMPWLATSYIAGPSLAEAVAARGPLPESTVLRLAAGLAEGLSAIHAAGVVHRDLKPSNVLLADDGPRLIDFGISRSMETSALTQTGTVVGSPGFMSPEQTRGREVGPPSDIFSLGAVLTFAATGEGPFGQGSTVALLYRVVSSQPDTAGLPGGLRLLIERCLAKDPRQRPAAAQLLAWLSEPPPVAYPPRDNAPERVPTASRPELRPVYDGQLTHTQGRWDQPSAEPKSRFDRPIASPVPPWDSRAAAPVRHRPAHRGWLIAAAAAAVLASVGAGAFVAGKIVPGHGASAASGSPSPAGATSSVANSGSPCGSDPGQDSHYAAGVNISNAATTAKDAFVAIWDPMAPRYGQQVYSSAGF